MNHLFINKTVPNNNIKTLYSKFSSFNILKTLNLINPQYYTVTKYFNLVYIVLTTAVVVHRAIYTVLTVPLGVEPPNNRALLLGSDVRVKQLQGGGRSPLISGIIH